MDRKSAFDILGIQPTDNIIKIKKAYAKRIREKHPEDNPEEFDVIRNAYIFLTSNVRIIPLESDKCEFEEDNDETSSETFKVIDVSSGITSSDTFIIDAQIEQIIDDYYAEKKLEEERKRIEIEHNANVRNEFEKFSGLYTLIREFRGVVYNNFQQSVFLDSSSLKSLRIHQLYYRGLQNNSFIVSFADALKKYELSVEDAELLLEDIRKVKKKNLPGYDYLEKIIMDNKHEIPQRKRNPGGTIAKIISLICISFILFFVILGIFALLFGDSFIYSLENGMYIVAFPVPLVLSLVFSSFICSKIFSN